MIKVFGSTNCLPSRRAIRWLGERGLTYQFFDLQDDVTQEIPLDVWIETFGWQQLIDRRNVAWRAHIKGRSQQIGQREAREIISRHPALLKTPLIGVRSQWLQGWNARNKICLLGLLPDHRLTLPESSRQVILRDEYKTVWLGPRPAVPGQSDFHK